jgi:hypothetical protein
MLLLVDIHMVMVLALAYSNIAGCFSPFCLAVLFCAVYFEDYQNSSFHSESSL